MTGRVQAVTVPPSRLTMAAPTNETLFLIKDVKPGLKNLNIVFIVLEIGK